MRVWITKYAATTGVRIAHMHADDVRRTRGLIRVEDEACVYYKLGSEAFLDEPSAKENATKRLEAALKSAQRKVEKLRTALAEMK